MQKNLNRKSRKKYTRHHSKMFTITCIGTGSTGNAYAVEDSAGHTLLLDCGISYKNVLKKFRKPIDAVLVTHKHGDHAGHIDEFTKRGIMVIGPRQVAEEHPGFMESLMETRMSTDEMKRYEKFSIAGFIVSPFTVRHDKDVETVGYHIRSEDKKSTMLYITDCAYVPYKFSDPIDEIIMEVNYDHESIAKSDDSIEIKKRITKTHTSLEQAVKFLEETNIKKLTRIHICHTSARNANKTLIKKTLAQETGKQIIIF